MRIGLWAALTGLASACGGGEEPPGALVATWAFDEGNCESNAVTTVRISWQEDGGEAQTGDFVCEDGTAELGVIPEGGATYQVNAEGLDAEGVARVESFGQSVTYHQSAGGPVDITLHPKASDVVVSWQMQDGGTCPSGVVLPYFVSIYEPPAAAGGELGAKVTEVQESCSSGSATLMGVAPGDYVVEVDSRAVTPAVRGTAPVTVVAGDNAQVAIDL